MLFADDAANEMIEQKTRPDPILSFALAELGIAGINVAATASNQVLANRNQIADLGQFIVAIQVKREQEGNVL